MINNILISVSFMLTAVFILWVITKDNRSINDQYAKLSRLIYISRVVMAGILMLLSLKYFSDATGLEIESYSYLGQYIPNLGTTYDVGTLILAFFNNILFVQFINAHRSVYITNEVK